MSSRIVDEIVVNLIAQADSYVANFDKATSAHGRFAESVQRLKSGAAFDLTAEAQRYKAATSNTIQADAEATTSRKRRSAEEIAAAKAVKDAERERRAAERAEAKAAADVAKAAEREKQAALKATQREQEKAAAAAARAGEAAERAAARAVAAAEREAVALATVAARREASSAARVYDIGATGRNADHSGNLPSGPVVLPGERSSLAAPAPRAATAGAATEAEINHLLIERVGLQERLKVATADEAVAIRARLTELNLSATYERAGLEGKELALKLDQELVIIEGQRAARAAENLALVEAANRATVEQLGLKAQIAAADSAEAVVLRDRMAALRQIAAYQATGKTEAEAAVIVAGEQAALEAKRTRDLAEQQVIIERQMRAQSAKIGSGIGAGAGLLVGGIGLAELSHLNDEYIRFSNSLKVAGVSELDFERVQARLLATSTRTGTSIGALSDTYRTIALASHDLGASQADILKVTDAVANSLRITGASGNGARAAILQLGHAFETGKVTAREFNGLQLNAYPLLQAVAAGSDKYAGSVAKLRAALLAGDLSSKDFFNALLAGSQILEGRAAKATLTTAQGFTALNNALVVYFGSADKAQGVSAALGAGLQKLAENLDVLIPAIAAVGTALTVGYVVRAVAAATATEGLGVALLGAFGGPVGLAISAVVLAIGAVAVHANSAAAASATLGGVTRSTASAVASLNNILAHDPSAAVARNAQELARQRTTQANATYQAAAAEIALRRAQAQGAIRELKANGREQTGTNRGGAQYTYYDDAPVRNGGGRTARDFRIAVHQDELNQVDRDQQQLDAAKRRADQAILHPPRASGGVSLDARSTKALASAEAKLDGLQKLAATATGARLERIQGQIKRTEAIVSDLRQGISPAAASAAEGGTGRGRRGPSAETLAHRAEAARVRGVHDDESFNSALKAARSAELEAQAELSNDASKRADLERERLRDAAAEAAKNRRLKGPKDPAQNGGVAGTGENTAAETATLLASDQRTLGFHLAIVDLNERRRTADEARQVDRDTLDARRDDLQGQLALAGTQAERRRIARQLLDIDFEQRRRAAEAVLTPDSKASKAERDIATNTLKRLPDQYAQAQAQSDQQYASPIARYREQIHDATADMNEALQGVAVGGLQALDDRLSGVIAKTLHLGGAFGEVADQIIASLIRIAVEKAIIGPIADALFPGAGGSTGGIGSFLGKIGLGGTRDAGGAVVGGVPYLVGEHRPEVFVPSTSGRIVPNNSPVSVGSAGTVLHQTVNIDASGSVNPEGYTAALVSHVRNETKSLIAQSQSVTLNAVPGRVQQAQVLGS